MINQQRLMALIPARGNSKGLPGKNTAPLSGIPLIAWSIAAARESAYVDSAIVTTDSQEIADIAVSFGAEVPFLRPAALAMDDTPGIAPVLHACQMLPGYDLVAVLQPTSPLRTAEHLDAALDLMAEQDADFCVSVTQAKQHPNWLFTESGDGYLQRYEQEAMKTDRQSLSPVYALNGAIYIARIPQMMKHGTLSGPKTIAFEMSQEHSADIDTAFDFKICEMLLAERAVS